MFLVIDGIDGSGKGTQLQLVQNELEKRGKKVLVLDYPRYGEKSAFAVEKYLNGDYGKGVGPKVASIFYAIDRFDSSTDFKKNMGNYDYIISNRYVSASMIHQGGKISDVNKRKEYIDWLENLEYNIFGIPKPDKIIFLSVSPQMSIKLVEQKEKREYIQGTTNKDIHEEDASHLTNAYNAAHEIVKSKSDWVLIECEKDGEMLSKKIITDKILETINII